MRERPVSIEKKYDWIVYATATLLVGGLAGYVLSVQTSRAASAPALATAAQTAPSTGATVADETQLNAYRDILARDPANVQAATAAGNMLYDAQRYAEAIPFYQQAFALAPRDISISTDLGTALWYAGRADEALAQFERSLALNATHPQTLFNLGVVRADGKHDYAGAVKAWEQLLTGNPSYSNAARVRELIADAKTKARG